MHTAQTGPRLVRWRLAVLAAFIALTALVSLWASAQPPPTLEFDAVWAGRTPPMGQVEQGSHGGELALADQSAVYLTVHNRGTTPEVLLAAYSALAARVALHDTIVRDGTFVMEPREAFTIPAGGRLELRPGQAHLMLLGLQQALRSGDMVPLTLTFQRAGSMSIEALVR